MRSDSGDQPLNYIRRQDRSVQDEAWIRSMLHRAAVGYLATVHGGQPFINSNLFYYDQDRHAIYIHTAHIGRTRSNIERHAKVCFSVSEMGRLLPAEEALEFSVEYWGVTVFGDATVVSPNEEKSIALQKLLDKYFPHLRPGEHYRPITDEELERTSVFRIDIGSWSGKRKVEAPEFPGAFLWDQGLGD